MVFSDAEEIASMLRNYGNVDIVIRKAGNEKSLVFLLDSEEVCSLPLSAAE